ncbi:hypothetical protein [Petrachloros mirabilis]
MSKDSVSNKTWFVRTVVAALITATLGGVVWLGKGRFEGRWEKAQLEKDRRARLVLLLDLLRESNEVFEDQRSRAFTLRDEVQLQYGSDKTAQYSTDRLLSALHDQFTEEQRRQHALLRGSTLGSMKQINGDICKWLETDSVFKSLQQTTSERKNLAIWLQRLERHLNQWHDKLPLIEADSTRALVWMADEDADGERFPVGIENVIQTFLDSESADFL